MSDKDDSDPPRHFRSDFEKLVWCAKRYFKECFEDLSNNARDESYKSIYEKLKDRSTYSQALFGVIEDMKKHPYKTAFTLLGIVLTCNPLGLLGFGGTVAIGSLFAILQSMGMVYSVAIPMIGLSIRVTAIAGPMIYGMINEHLVKKVKLWVRSSQVFFGNSARLLEQCAGGWQALWANIDLQNKRLPKDGHQD
jgi:hypothetical protein